MSGWLLTTRAWRAGLGARRQRAAEPSLTDNSRLLDVLFDRSPMAVAVFGRDLVLWRWNLAWADFVGMHGAVSADQVVVGRTIFDYFPGTEQVILPAVAPVLAGATRRYCAVPFNRPNGTTSYWDLVFIPLCEDGEVAGLVGLVTEATERRRAEDELLRAARRFQSIMRNSSDLVMVVDAEGIVSYAAPSIERVVGINPAFAIGRNLVDPVHPNDVATVRQLLSDSLARPGESQARRFRLKRVDGSWRTVDGVMINLLGDPDVQGVVLNLRDVTERAHTEAELHRRDAILEAVRFAAHRFLDSPGSWRTNIDEVMKSLGTAAGASRAYLFENYEGSDGSLWSSQRHEWVAEGISSELDNADLIALSYRGLGLDHFAELMARGEAMASHVADMTSAERAILEPQGVLAIAVVPIFVDDQWWGFLGLDDCECERHWSTAEIDALKAAASTLGAAIQLQRALSQLREQQEQYQQVFEATGDGLVISDIKGGYVQANPAFHRMHGYQPGELAAVWASKGLPHCDATQPGARSTRDRIGVRKDGSTFPVQITTSSFTFGGQPHVLSVVHDDTERAQAFELLETRINALSAIAASTRVNQALSETLDTITESVVAATPAVACSAYVLDDETGGRRVFASVGLPDGYPEGIEQHWCGVEASPNTHEIGEHGLLVVRDAVRRALRSPGRSLLYSVLGGVEWDTVVMVSLESHRKFGSVNAYYPHGVEPSPDEIAFLRAVADQGAVAVENAELLAEARSRAGAEERQRLARELHDSVSQALYGIALGARTARSLAEKHPDELSEPLDYVLSLADAAMTEMRSLIFELRPNSLEMEGLVAALEKRVAVLRSRHGLAVRAQFCAEPKLPPPLKETVYRIAQEALHNAVKHAHAGQVAIRLSVDQGAVELEIVDDGVGFEPTEPKPGHLGLHSMRERAVAQGGEIVIDSRRGVGTTIHARLPVPPSPGESAGTGG